MVSSEELLGKVYREFLALRERLDSLERMMIPEVEVSARERRLIRFLGTPSIWRICKWRRISTGFSSATLGSSTRSIGMKTW